MASKNDINFARFLKLGVAFAVIRSKPSNQSAKEHAEHLSALFKIAQQKWQEKYEEAQAEILNLKQQLLLSTSLPLTQASGDGSNFDSQPLFPTPPSSSEDPKLETPVPGLESLHQDVLYLQSVARLQEAKGLTLSPSPSNQTQVTRATIQHSLQCVRCTMLDTARPVSPSLLAASVLNVLQVLDQQADDQWTKNCYHTLKDILSLLVKRLMATDRLHTKTGASSFQLLEVLSSFHKTSSPVYLQDVLDVFVDYVKEFCTHLRQSRVETIPFSPIMAENIVHVLQAMETCVHQTRGLLSSKEGHGICLKIQEPLESCLLHLSQAYPLLAHTVWRVASLLELCLSHPD